jgi:hypothetical protein
MARRIHFPGIVDIVRVSDPAEIRALDDEPRIDRNFVPRGPLANRLIVGRIRRWFSIAGQPLPSLTRRGDEVRAQRQRELAQALDPSQAPALWTDAQIRELAAYLCGGGGDEPTAILVQQIVGSLFDPSYRADRDTWRAARMIDQFRNGFSPREIVWRLTGQLRRARDLLVERAKEDRWRMHGAAIGVHGIVHALARMRQLRASPTANSLTDDAVLARCLAPPKQAPRTLEAPLETPLVDGRLSAGAILVFRLEDAFAQAPDAEMVFMHGHWNACPARAFVTALLKAVWRRSLEEKSSP